MEFDRTFLLLCGAEVLVVAAGNLAAALILQVIVLGAFLFAAVLHVTGISVLLGLAVALGCGYLALTAYDYRLTLRAGERA